MPPAASQHIPQLPPSMHMLCHQAPMVPVLMIDDLAHAVPLAEALIAGGLPVLEVSLRTPVALQAIALMARVPGATIGAGTVLNPKDAANALKSGATFAISPGASRQLIDCCKDLDLPLLPGAASATEVMRLLDYRFDLIKFFPAVAAGGVATLRSFGRLFPQVHFCPAGGISQANAQDYLSLANVACVGGSWVAPPNMLTDERWVEIRQMAHKARRLNNGRAGPPSPSNTAD